MSALDSLNQRLSVGVKIAALLGVMLFVAGLNVGAVYYYQGQVTTLESSVNYAGQQRMLSQRIPFVGYMLSKGHDDQELLRESIRQYDRNLRVVDEGGTIDGNRLKAAPPATREELAREREVWGTYREHATTLVETDPYDPKFQESLQYLVDNRESLSSGREKVVDAYASAGPSYAEERQVAADLEARSNRIVQLGLELKHLTTKTGTESREKLAQQNSDRVDRLQSELEANVEAYDASLEALRNGGTYDGQSLDEPPAPATGPLGTLDQRWSAFAPHARTVATRDRLNPTFWKSLSYVEHNSAKLKSVSDDVVVAFSDVNERRVAFMKELLVGLFVLDLLVFALGTYFGRRYIGTPVSQLREVADSLARGDTAVDVGETVDLDVDEDLSDDERRDELAQLVDAFDGLQAYLTTVAGQAEALADQDFDAAVLDEDVPGEFGDTLSRMQTDLQELVGDLERLNRRLEAKAEDYQAVMERAADGDLTQRMDPEGESEAMARIGTTFNEMMADLEGTVARIRAFATDVAASSEEATASASEVQQASEQVSESVQEISAGADDQRAHLDEVSGEMANLSGTIEEVASAASEVATTAQRAADVGREGEAAASEAIEDMNAIESTATDTVGEIESLADEVAEIEEIVDLITDIAEQTNLLALNASIEAARAGEAGEGFAVVADEIKSLAEEAGAATDRIDARIEAIQASTADSVDEVREMGDRISRGSDTVEEALDALDEVADRVERANSGMQEISDAADDQAASSEEVVSMVDDVAGVAEETSAEAESVSAAAEEQAASLTEVSDSVASLSERAEDLAEILDEFSIHDDAGGLGGADATRPATADGGSRHTDASD